MAISFHCPICASEFVAPDEFAGQQARCGGCGNVVDVPLQGEPSGLAAVEDRSTPVAGVSLHSPPATPAFSQESAAPNNKALLIGAGVVGAGLVLLVALVGLFNLISQGDNGLPPNHSLNQPLVPPPHVGPNVREPVVAAPPAWNVQPDPPEDASLAVTQVDPNAVLPGRLFFSRQPGHYAIAEERGEGGGKLFRVYDLTTGEPHGDGVVSRQQLDHRAHFRDLSPSGAFFIAAEKEATPPTIHVFLPLEGKLQATITLPDAAENKFGFGIAGFRRMVAAHVDERGELTLQLHDLIQPDAKLLAIRHVPVDNERFDPATLATSPGGRYAALLTQQGERLLVWDLHSGKLVGDRAYSGGGLWPGLAFSPDGRRLARMCKAEPDYQLSVIDLATGETRPGQAYSGDLKGNQIAYSGQRLEWSASGKYLLFCGQDLIDATSGKLVDAIRHDDAVASHAWCRIVEDDLVLHQRGVASKEKTYAVSPLAKRLASVPPPIEPSRAQIAAADLPKEPAETAPADETSSQLKPPTEATPKVIVIKPDPPTPVPVTEKPTPDEPAVAIADSDPETALRSEREARWEIPADPPAAMPTVKSGKIEIKLADGSHELIFPPGPSRFCVLRSTNDGKWQHTAIDLGTGKPIGKTITDEIRGLYPVVSPDGRYIADEMGGERVTGVWSFATGERTCILTNGKWGFDLFTFVGPHRLVTVHNGDRETLLTTWDVRTGEQHGQFVVHDEYLSTDERCIAPSPGGKLLAMLCNTTIKIVDPAAGKILGERSLEYLAKREYISLFGRAIDLSSIETAGIAFSPDGTRLAAVLKAGGSGMVVCLDARSGGVVFERLLESTTNWHSGRNDEEHENRLDWTPDGLGIQVAGSVLLDANTGKDLLTMPWNSDLDAPRRIIRPWDMLTIGRDSENDDYLFTMPLPKEAIDKAIAQVQGEGEAIDAILPPRTDIRRDAVVKLPNLASDVPWNVPIYGVAYAEGLRDRIEIADGHEKVRHVRFAGPESGKVIVIKSEEVNSEKTTWLQQFDTRSKAKSDRLKIHDPYRLADVSQSGHAALLAYPDAPTRNERLDLVGFNPKKHLAGWRPYADADVTDNARQTGSLKSLAWAAMVGDDQAVTLSKSGRLIGWKVPECSAVYETEGVAKHSIPMLSPGRRTLALVRNTGIDLLDARTGAAQGRIALAPRSDLIRCAFRDDGKELYVWAFQGQQGAILQRFDLATGKLIATTVAPTAAVKHHPWPNYPFERMHHTLCRRDGTMLLDACTLFDAERSILAWRYVLDRDELAADNSPDGRLWHCNNYYAKPSQSVELMPATINGPEVRAKTAAIRPPNQYALGPGASVRLLVDLKGAGLGHLEDRVVTACQKALAARGVTVDPAAKSQLSIVAVSFDSGRKLAIPKEAVVIARGVEEIKEKFWFVPDMEFKARLTVIDDSGIPCHRHDGYARPYDIFAPPSPTFPDDKVQAARDFLDKQFLSDEAIDNMLPPIIYRHAQSILPGETFLTSDPTEKMPDNQKLDPLVARPDHAIWPQATPRTPLAAPR